jgi:HEAT repeat protein
VVAEVLDQQVELLLAVHGQHALLDGLHRRRTPPELITALSGAMRDQNPKVRLEAVYALGVVAVLPLDPAAAETLMGGLRDSQADIRVAAARVLGGLRVRQAGDALIQAVNDPETAVRAASMRSLGDIREARAIQALMEQFTYYEQGPLADAAFDGLARIGNPASIPLFTSQLTSRNADWRRLAAEGLARCGDARAAASVETVLANEKKVPVQLARAFAMQAAGRPGLDALVAALATPATQAQAMGYLVELGPPVADPLAASLTNPNPQIRQGVAMTLGLIGGEPAVSALEPVRRDADTEVARAAERAIARIRIRGE